MLVATAIALLALGWQQPFDPPPAERSAEPRVERVNVLLVVTDDTGLDMVGCYG